MLLAVEEADRSSSTRRDVYAALRAVFDDTVTNGLLGASPAVRVKRRASGADVVVTDAVDAGRAWAAASLVRSAAPLQR